MMNGEKAALTYKGNFKGQYEVRLTRFHSAWDRNMVKPLTILPTRLDTKVATANLGQLVFRCYAGLGEGVEQNPNGVEGVPDPGGGVGGTTTAG